MSWLFSRAMAESYSEENCSDGEPYAPLNVMPTPHKFWRNDKMMECSKLSRFGLTCRVLTDTHGEALLTSYLADFRARISARQEKEPASTERAAGSGKKWRGSFAKYDRDSRSWKTHQFSILGGLDEFSEIWPKWGSMRNGESYQRNSVAPRIGENASGLWPTAELRRADDEL